MDQQIFQHTWEQIYDQNKSSRPYWEVLSFYLIVAIGAVCEPMPTETSAQLERISNTLYKQAWALFDRTLSSSSMEAVRVLLLYVSLIYGSFLSG